MPRATRRSRLAAIGVRVGLVLAVLAAVSLSGCAETLFYHPVHGPSPLPRDAEEVVFESRDGTRLHGALVRARGEARGTVLVLHGNAGRLGDHLPISSWLTQHGFDVFAFDYRGYGLSEGSPDREGLHADALGALDHVLARDDVTPGRLAVWGQSLGGAVALAALGERGAGGIAAVVVESAFPTYRSVANAVLGGTALTRPLVALLVRDGLDPVDGLGALDDVPLLIAHGDADPVVPVSQGRVLARAAGPDARYWEVPGGGHLTLFLPGTEQARRLVDFLEEHVP